MWIRHGCVGLVCTIARQLDNIDVLCYMLPKLEMYIEQPIIQIREEVHNLMHCNLLIQSQNSYHAKIVMFSVDVAQCPQRSTATSIV